ncbi:ankyrin repeat domain-containing protein [Neisseria weixii]|uniref:ankyrin repeat domain-containing protein n=1 Tax=Neisseria weixii TaxID=1853276 RepID=UPI001F330A1A|nr:ankyrin repeat domain-containing protein [Neisseria weixii]
MKNQDIEFYEEMKEKYKNDVGMLVTFAGDQGDIAFLQELAETGRFNPLATTPLEGWSYLHKVNLGEACPLSTIRFYLDKGVAVNAQDCYGMTPLHYALRVQNADAAIALLEAGADPNIPNIDNLRPLSMVGYTKDRLDVLELMLKTEVMSIILLMIMKLFWKVGSLVPFHLNGKLIFIN